jgi:tetratricopeptide (TPR) repeat protein
MESTYAQTEGILSGHLDEAERLLAQRHFLKAKEVASTTLANASEWPRARLIVAEACAGMGSALDAESAYREALALQPSMPQATCGLARLVRKSRPAEALELLEGLLALHPSNIPALDLLCDVLALQNRSRDAKDFINRAMMWAPTNARLQVLRGEWLIRVGDAAAGVVHLKGILKGKPASPAVWLTLVREAEARNDFEEAFRLAGTAVAACPNIVWLWVRQALMFAAAGRRAELEHHISARPVPPISAPTDFLSWARLMRRIDASDRVRAALDKASPVLCDALLNQKQGALLRADLAREDGEPLKAIGYIKHALGLAQQDVGLLRHLFDLAFCVGDLALVNEVANRLHHTNPRNHGGLEMFLLHDARIFPDVMGSIYDVMQSPQELRLRALSEIVQDEPACLPAAVAWLNQFFAQKINSASEPGVRIPKVLYFAEDPSPGWRDKHPDFEWMDLRIDHILSAAHRQLTAGTARALGRHSKTNAKDILRLSSLKEAGGWWVNPSAPCIESVECLGSGGATLVMCLNHRGFITSDLIGCVAGDAAVSAALAISIASLAEIPTEYLSRVTTGSPAMTLGAAHVLSKRLLAGESTTEVSLITLMKREFLQGLPWPQ